MDDIINNKKYNYEERITYIITNDPFLSEFINEPQLLQPIGKVEKKDGCMTKPILETPETTGKDQLIALNSFDEKNNKFLQYHNRIFPSPAYFKQGIKESFPIVYARRGIVDSLLKFLEILPDNYGIIVYDGYRPISVQKSLYDDFYEKLKNDTENKNKTADELKEIIKSYVSVPSLDKTKPSTHNTGGAIDFSICDLNGVELNFGCEFDDFRPIANTTHFEEKYLSNEELTDNELNILLNRRILSNLAKSNSVGLQLFDGEWWHFDKNNQWDLKLPNAIYGSCDLNNIQIDNTNNLYNYIIRTPRFHNQINNIINIEQDVKKII